MEARIAISNEFISVRVGNRRVAVRIEGERENPLANAVLMMPEVFRQLRKAGATTVLAEGPALRGPLSAAEWALLTPKNDAELEAARQAALAVLPVRGNAKIVGVGELAAALSGLGGSGSGGSSDLD